MDVLETTQWYALPVPVYAALVAAEVAISRRRGEPYGLARTIGNLSGGLGELVVGLFLGPVLVGLYLFAYEALRLVTWPAGSPWPWVLAIVGGDLCYYVYHRAGHRVGVFWAIHGVHHQGDRFNFTVAMRHPWLSDLYSWPFYAPLPLLGVGPAPFFVGMAVISFYALFVHTRAYDFPSFGVLVTPGNHIVHHARNPRYIGRNMGATLVVWDRLFGTYAEVVPDEPPDLGVPGGYRAHDGARSQWLFWGDLLRAARQARSLRGKVSVMLGRPGTLPPGAVPPPPESAVDEEAIPRSVGLYVAAQFALTAAAALLVLWGRDHVRLAAQIAMAVLVLWGISSLGGLLDRRRWAPWSEGLRLACATAAVVLLWR